jgi:hypothetical protein
MLRACALLSLVACACAPPTPRIDAGAAALDAGFAADDGGGAVDAGPVPVDCASDPTGKRCFGAILLACDAQGESIGIDCAAVWPGAVCGDVSEDFGASCLLAPGTACLDDQTGAVLPCAGNEPGCVDDGATIACEEGVGACTTDDDGSCDGDDLIYACAATQPFTIRCAAYGATCGDGVCADADEGMFCFPQLIECDPALDCVDYLCTAPADAGVADGG